MVVRLPIFEFSCSRLTNDLPRFIEPLQGKGVAGENVVQNRLIRCKPESLRRRLRRFLILPQFTVHKPQIAIGFGFPRVALNALLIYLDRLIQSAGYMPIVVSSDRQTFPFTGMLPQLKSPGEVLAASLRLAKTVVVVAHCPVAHGKIRIKLYGTLMVRQGRGSAFLVVRSQAKAVRLQSFQRRCGGLFERNIKLLHSSQRFSQLAAKLGCRLAQYVQHLLLGRCGHLLLGERISALAIHRLKP